MLLENTLINLVVYEPDLYSLHGDKVTYWFVARKVQFHTRKYQNGMSRDLDLASAPLQAPAMKIEKSRVMLKTSSFRNFA